VARANLGIGRAYYSEQKYGQALPFLRKAGSGLTGGNVVAESYLKAGECLFMLGRSADALACLRSIARIPQESFDSAAKRSDWFVRGACWEARALMHLSNYSEAIQTCDSTIRSNPDVDPALIRELKLLKANALMNTGKLEGALAIVRAMHAENISEELNALTDDLIGDFYAQVGRDSDAIRAYQHVIDRHTGQTEVCAGARCKLANCYLRAGDKDRAGKLLREVVDEHPATTWKSHAENLLKNSSADHTAAK